jgi:hypothetical protein
MVRHASLTALAVFVVALAIGGCGESGSNPVLFPETIFSVTPSGGGVFAVDFVDGGGVRHLFPANVQFSGTSTFVFHILGAPTPFNGRFKRISGGDIEVVLTVAEQPSVGPLFSTNLPGCCQTTEQSCQSCFVDADCAASPTGASCVQTLDIPPGPGPGPVPRANPDVRVDVCVPFPGTSSCSLNGDAGVFGQPFSGTIGDQFITHLVNGSAPSVYFLTNARDNVSAVVSGSGQLLQAQLFINDQLTDTESGTGDVIIRHDL